MAPRRRRRRTEWRRTRPRRPGPPSAPRTDPRPGRRRARPRRAGDLPAWIWTSSRPPGLLILGRAVPGLFQHVEIPRCGISRGAMRSAPAGAGDDAGLVAGSALAEGAL